MFLANFFKPINIAARPVLLRWKSEKYTKENMPVERFGSHFLQNGLINLISLPACHIFNAFSVDTHIGYRNSHKAIWPYSHNGQNMAIWPYNHIAIWYLE